MPQRDLQLLLIYGIIIDLLLKEKLHGRPGKGGQHTEDGNMQMLVARDKQQFEKLWQEASDPVSGSVHFQNGLVHFLVANSSFSTISGVGLTYVVRFAFRAFCELFEAAIQTHADRTRGVVSRVDERYYEDDLGSQLALALQTKLAKQCLAFVLKEAHNAFQNDEFAEFVEDFLEYLARNFSALESLKINLLLNPEKELIGKLLYGYKMSVRNRNIRLRRPGAQFSDLYPKNWYIVVIHIGCLNLLAWDDPRYESIVLGYIKEQCPGARKISQFRKETRVQKLVDELVIFWAQNGKLDSISTAT